MTGKGLMALVEAEQYATLERKLAEASLAELYKVWQDAAYLKERTRFLLKEQHGIILP